jgi:hypothetical protein
MKTKQEFISFISNNAGLLESPLTNDQLMKMKLDELKPLALEIQSKIGDDDDANDEITTTSSIEKVAVKPAERLQGIEYKVFTTNTESGAIVDISCAMLALKKITVSNKKLRFQFVFGTHLVSLTNQNLVNIFEEEYNSQIKDFNDAFRGMLFPIVEDAITPMQERGTMYTKTFNGRILASASEIIQAGIELQEQKDYQAIQDNKKADKKAENIVKVIGKLNKDDKTVALSGLFNMLNDL